MRSLTEVTNRAAGHRPARLWASGLFGAPLEGCSGAMVHEVSDHPSAGLLIRLLDGEVDFLSISAMSAVSVALSRQWA
jgi:hypothetical protein